MVSPSGIVFVSVTAVPDATSEDIATFELVEETGLVFEFVNFALLGILDAVLFSDEVGTSSCNAVLLESEAFKSPVTPLELVFLLSVLLLDISSNSTNTRETNVSCFF